MSSSEEEEEEREERERLRSAVVTSADLSSSSRPALDSTSASLDQQTFLARRLEQLLDSIYDFTSPPLSSTVPTSSHDYSSGVRLTSSSLHPVTPSHPHTVTPSHLHPVTPSHPAPFPEHDSPAHSPASSDDDTAHERRLQEAVYDLTLLIPQSRKQQDTTR